MAVLAVAPTAELVAVLVPAGWADPAVSMLALELAALCSCRCCACGRIPCTVGTVSSTGQNCVRSADSSRRASDIPTPSASLHTSHTVLAACVNSETECCWAVPVPAVVLSAVQVLGTAVVVACCDPVGTENPPRAGAGVYTG